MTEKKKVGAKKKENKRNERVVVLITPENKDAITEIAESRGLGVSTMVHQWILQTIKEEAEK